MVEMKNVSKTYFNGTVALRDINLKMDKGSLFLCSDQALRKIVPC